MHRGGQVEYKKNRWYHFYLLIQYIIHSIFSREQNDTIKLVYTRNDSNKQLLCSRTISELLSVPSYLCSRYINYVWVGFSLSTTLGKGI